MLAQARPLMEQLPDGLLREQLLTELAREGGVSPQVLLGHWQGAARSGGRSPSGPQMTGQPGPADRSRPTPPTAHLQDAGSPAPPSWVDDMGGHPGDGWSPGDSATADHWGEWGNGPGNAAPSRPGSPYRQGWSGSGSRSQGQGQAGPGFGPKGQGRTGSTWKGKGGGRWRDRDEAPWPRLPPPRTTTPLDRAAWLLVHDAQLWLHLPADIHELLARQPSPYGEFFTGIDRIVHDQGALPMSTLLTDLLADPGTETAGPGLRLLIERLRGLHEFNENGDPAGELAGVLHQLRLQAVNDEITLLSESGDLSDEARQQHRRLLEELRTGSEVKRHARTKGCRSRHRNRIRLLGQVRLRRRCNGYNPRFAPKARVTAATADPGHPRHGHLIPATDPPVLHPDLFTPACPPEPIRPSPGALRPCACQAVNGPAGAP